MSHINQKETFADMLTHLDYRKLDQFKHIEAIRKKDEENTNISFMSELIQSISYQILTMNFSVTAAKIKIMYVIDLIGHYQLADNAELIQKLNQLIPLFEEKYGESFDSLSLNNNRLSPQKYRHCVEIINDFVNDQPLININEADVFLKQSNNDDSSILKEINAAQFWLS